LIRQQFKGVNPRKLSEEDFAELLAEAIWLKQYDRELMEAAMINAMAKAFMGKEALVFKK
jgi:hypothetical protein